MKAAVYTGTRNYYPYMIPAVKSLLAHSDVDEVYLLIEDDVFPYKLNEKVKTINVSDQEYFRDGPNMNSRFTYMAMMRAALAFVFPSYDRILSLDCDTIVDQDISDLWDLPIEDCYFSASPEYHKTTRDFMYCNVGVTLFNLAKLRDGKAQEVIDRINTEHFDFVEQDAFNYLCQSFIYPMDGDYNACTWTTHTDHPKIYHFAGYRDWMGFPEVQKYL